MPELPEVETVKNTLEKQLINKTITEVLVLYPNIIETENITKFCEQIKGQTIRKMQRRGKWLMFILDDYVLFSHLRMEGKYFFKTSVEPVEKHEHVIFRLNSNEELRYQDTRKFGRMRLVEKDKINSTKPLCELGLEPWDESLTSTYLKEKFKNKKLPIKTVLLDQSIIAGIGNIYVNEILFASKINPYLKASSCQDDDLEKIIINTKRIMEKAILDGGTTIKSYESSKGVHGRFQQYLKVHGKEASPCPCCHTPIVKETIGGRGTYYCPNCQKMISEESS